MTYVEELLQLQASLSAALSGQPEVALREYTAVVKMDGEEPTAGKQTNAATQAQQETTVAGKSGGTNAAALGRELQQLQMAKGRVSALRQSAAENQTRSALERQGVLVSSSTADRYQGGLTGYFAGSLKSSGVAGAETQRSMSEISRFFERDARRYGG